MKKEFGLFDTIDQVWLGNDAGPKLFTEKLLAQAASQVACVHLGWAETRVIPKRYRRGQLKLRDELATRRTPLRALQALEGGKFE